MRFDGEHKAQTMLTAYDETKTTQLAAYLLQKSEGEMFLLKLLKLLYITDREAFRQLGRPVTFDRYVSMDHGPVLSITYNLMNGTVRGCGDWCATISPRDGNKLRVVDEAEVAFDRLSEAELAIADQVFDSYGHIPRFDLADFTHTFKEWQDPNGSSIPIDHRDILRALDFDEAQIDLIQENIREQQASADFFEVA
jgi:uncharacterized phage-associated protein